MDKSGGGAIIFLLLLASLLATAIANSVLNTNDGGHHSMLKRETNAQAMATDPIAQTAMNKHKLNEEFEERVGEMRDGCFPRPRGIGCRCVVKDAQGHDLERIFQSNEECKVRVTPEPIAQTAMNKQKLNEEFKEKVAGLKDGCFPRPNEIGCRCVVKDAAGHDLERIYQTNEECKVSSDASASRGKREARVQQAVPNSEVGPRDRAQQKTNSPHSAGAGGGDPIAERARQNYAAVLNELKNKFAGLREGCYPRPKGCLCVVGKDATGREITERRMKDSDCKCSPGERSRDCPAQGGA